MWKYMQIEVLLSQVLDLMEVQVHV
jgi:hypothetical protein